MPEKINTFEAYEKLAESYSQMIDYKAHNAFYDRPNTLSLLPDVAGKFILDAGCGPGKYAEILISKGADVIGVDLSEKMIQEAQKRNKNKGDFMVHDLTKPLDFLANEKVDLVISPLVLEYIEDWNPVFKEFYRVLKPNGVFVFSINHPFFEFNYFKSDNYFATEKVKCTWTGFGFPVEIESFRRSLTDCIEPLSNNGFFIDKILEPKPTPEFKEHDPKHYKELMAFPAFLCIRALKKG